MNYSEGATEIFADQLDDEYFYDHSIKYSEGETQTFADALGAEFTVGSVRPLLINDHGLSKVHFNQG